MLLILEKCRGECRLERWEIIEGWGLNLESREGRGENGGMHPLGWLSGHWSGENGLRHKVRTGLVTLAGQIGRADSLGEESRK